MKVVISDIIGTRSVAYHDEGLIILEILNNAISSKTPVELSFQGIRQSASQFLHTAIGTLYLNFPSEIVDSLLSYDLADVPNLKDKIEDAKWSALHSSEYEKFVENAIS